MVTNIWVSLATLNTQNKPEYGRGTSDTWLLGKGQYGRAEYDSAGQFKRSKGLIYNHVESIGYGKYSLALTFSDLKAWDDNSLSWALSQIHVCIPESTMYLMAHICLNYTILKVER